MKNELIKVHFLKQIIRSLMKYEEYGMRDEGGWKGEGDD